jgi:hypothetical protein
MERIEAWEKNEDFGETWKYSGMAKIKKEFLSLMNVEWTNAKQDG